MRRIVLLLIFIFSLNSIYSMEAKLVVKGYKMSVPEDNEIMLEITSAVYSNDEQMSFLPNDSTSYIDLDLKKNSLLASGGSYISFSNSTIFSFRAIGKNTGKYWLKMNLTPFKLYVDGVESADENGIIDAYFQLGSMDYSFNGDSIEIPSNKEFSNISLAKGAVLAGVTEKKDSSDIISSVNTVDFNIWWDVVDRVIANSDSYAWIVRGAVAMSIIRADYENIDTPYGEYRSYITITVGVNE